MKTYDETTKSILEKIDKEKAFNANKKYKIPKVLYAAAILLIAFGSFRIYKTLDYNKMELVDITEQNIVSSEKSVTYSSFENDTFIHNDIEYKLTPNLDENAKEQVEPIIADNSISIVFTYNDTLYSLSSNSNNITDFNEVLESLK